MTSAERSLYAFLTNWCDYTRTEALKTIERNRREKKRRMAA